jgi:hypothetical protein
MEKQVKRSVQREISDLGEAAYAKMKGFRCIGRRGRCFYFEVVDNEAKFDAINLEYINSSCHDFDACIMSMKKVAERMAEPTRSLRKSVSDLGSAAYLRMNGFKCAGRKGKNFFFEVEDEDADKFDALNFEYVNSLYHDFDSAIMCLKKIGEYFPPQI